MSEARLRCDTCAYVITVARVDGEFVLICHCTGDDGLDPVPLEAVDDRPERWEPVPRDDNGGQMP